MTTPSPWWTARRHQDRRPFLTARGAIKTAIRSWFLDQGFLEAEPGCLQLSPGNEPHLHAFKTQLTRSDLSTREVYLHTSPEFAMKKLLAAGEEKIFAFSPCFRNRERGPLHAPEFTMLEWYRANTGYETLFEDCAAILGVAAKASGRTLWSWRGVSCDSVSAYRRKIVVQAFAEHADIALRETFDELHTNRDALAAGAAALDYRITEAHTWSDIFSLLVAGSIEPNLGIGQPEILDQYPIHEAALARPARGDPTVAERFELYVCGVELANGFGELTDSKVQRARFEQWADDKQRIYGTRVPVDEGFLNALDHMPPASGCALGFDRLVMLASGATHIDQVLWTPLET